MRKAIKQKRLKVTKSIVAKKGQGDKGEVEKAGRKITDRP